MMNDLCCGIRMWAQFSFVLSQITRLTDGRTAFSWLYGALYYMQSHRKNALISDGVSFFKIKRYTRTCIRDILCLNVSLLVAKFVCIRRLMWMLY